MLFVPVEITKNTIGDVFDEVVAQRADAVALFFKGEEFTYKEIKEKVDLLAKGLLKLGVKRGDHVAIWMVNRPEWIFFELAIYKIGAVLVTMNTRYRIEEARHILGQSDATTIILSDRFWKCEFMEMFCELVPELQSSEPGALKSTVFPLLRTVISLGSSSQKGAFDLDGVMALGRGVSDKELARAQSACDPKDVALIIYTSGTTGNPKGAMASQKSILSRELTYNQWFKVTEDDHVFCGTPLFYIFACVTGVLGTFRAGGKLCLMETFDAEEALKIIDAESCTVINGVPSMFIMMIEHPDFAKYDVSSCRTGIMGGSPMPVSQASAVIERMVPQIASVWGLTECVTNATATRLGDPGDLVASTVGVALPDCEVLVFDPATNQPLPPGMQGELRIRSAANMVGYYKMPEATAKVFGDDGWLRTNDLGVMDENGYFKITGRISDMFIVGGMNAYPAEIENHIAKHPKVAQVEVIGVPDHRLGEVSMAFVMLKNGQTATEEEIIEFCRGKLANFKMPRYVRFVSEFPLTVTGKVQKFKLQEQAQKELGLAGVFTR